MSTNPSSLLTQAGMVLDLIAFFLTIPELLNEKQLLIVQKILREVLFWAGVTLFVFSVLLGIAFLTSMNILPLLHTIGPFLGLSPESVYSHWIWLALFSPQIMVLSAPQKMVALSSPQIMILLLSWLALKTMEAAEILARDSELRKILLKIGVFFFIGGWVMQLIAALFF